MIRWRDLGFVDTHVHLEDFDLAEGTMLIHRAVAAGVVGLIAVGTTAESCERLLRWQDRFPDFVNIALGLHPELPHSKSELIQVCKQIRDQKERLVAIGEVGLPYYSQMGLSDPEGCQNRATVFAELAVETRLPLIVHAVHEATLPMLEILVDRRVGSAVFHWLKAPLSVADLVTSCGYCVSVTPRLEHRESDRQIALRIPSSKLVVETDAPEPYNGKASEPADVALAALILSRIRSLSLEVVEKDLLNATTALFPRLVTATGSCT